MADVRAIASGNWTNTAIWNTGALPTSADDVWANTFTITVDTSPTVLSIRNGSTTNVTAGGQFAATSGMTLTCTGAGVVGAGSTTTTAVLTVNITAGQTCNLVASVTGGTGGTTCTAVSVTSGILNITGAVTGGAGGSSSSAAVVVAGAGGAVNVTGNVASGASSVGIGINFTAGGTASVTGTVSAHSSSSAVGINVANSSATFIHVGTVQAGAGAAGITGLVGALVWLSGPFLTTSQGVNPVTAARWLWNATYVLPTYYQIRTPAPSNVIRPLYTADSVGGNPAVADVRNGTVYGPSNELTGTCAVPGAASVLSGVPVDNTTGTATISAASIRAAVGLASANLDTQLASISGGGGGGPTAVQIRQEMDANSTKLANLDTTISSRLASSGYTTPPTASSIASAVWQSLTSGLSTAGSIGKLLVDNVNATISSAASDSSGVTTLLNRLTSGRAANLDNLNTAPPTAAAIATAVNSALDRTGFSLTSAERSAIATAVEQSILNEGDGQQVLNAIVGAIGNTNVDQVALVAAIRADLERSGGTLATRLAASSYTAPLDAAGTRSAVGLSTNNLDAQLSGLSNGISNLPSASAIAAAVWSATTRTLTTAIDNSATIAAAVWNYATGRTITGGTVDTVTNASGSAPSAASVAAAVRTELATELARLDAAISSRLASSGYSSAPTAAAVAAEVNAALDRTGFSLTSAERQAISTAVQAGILNESDGQAVVTALVSAIGNTNVDQVALVAAIRADLERQGGTLASRSTLTAAQVRTELAPELARVANCATTQEVDDIIEGALQ